MYKKGNVYAGQDLKIVSTASHKGGKASLSACEIIFVGESSPSLWLDDHHRWACPLSVEASQQLGEGVAQAFEDKRFHERHKRAQITARSSSDDKHSVFV